MIIPVKKCMDIKADHHYEILCQVLEIFFLSYHKLFYYGGRTTAENNKIIYYNLKKIILYGSRARGDHREDSDIDLLIVKKTKKRFFFK